MACGGREDEFLNQVDDEHSDEASSFRGVFFSWGFLLAAGLLVFEVTHQPVYGIAVACTKVAWQNIANAFWLYRHSLSRGQKWANLTFHLSVACARYALVGLPVSAVVTLVSDCINPRGMMPQQAEVLLLASLSLATVHWFFTWLSVWFAIPARVRLYQHPDLTTARKSRGPIPIRRAGIIRTRIYIATGCSVVTFGLLGVFARFSALWWLGLPVLAVIVVWITFRAAMPMSAVTEDEHLRHSSE